MTAPLIRIQNVQKYYGSYHALRDVSVDIGAGEFFSLLGPSGCGKTTLLRTIAGFEEFESGTLTLGGVDMVGVPANKRPTNMVFQSYAIFPHLSVGDNVGFGLRRRTDLTGEARASLVADALHMVGLKGYGARAAHALSGGQRQRVALARALVLKPKVLLLDEPLSALDKKMREQMQTELRRLQRHVGITFILVTHDQEEALTMSDRIAVMFEGRIAQLATPQTLYAQPASRAVAEFIGTMSFLPAQISGDRADVAGLGTVPVTADQCAEGATGTCVAGVRPEGMALDFDETGQGTPGEVVEREYFGDMTSYHVRLDGTDRLVEIAMKNGPGIPVLDPGARTRVQWSPEALRYFAA
ncbi:ABC transporter ATP-binding protein [Dinoroseobacter sp. PD6]|uniref:ABC transporter ATP-binding protein n=1 Tax=Dinoroseobacter sp. PD6 TaxID=3028384 RepID=UPI00237BDF2E|nr:ABC transporter ATP-binding protein [Dinoroseobacter sp. PD6]MDD9715569.1 ABC transporter ATP-binding protein [Dinoroseobacter sp. PD6]